MGQKVKKVCGQDFDHWTWQKVCLQGNNNSYLKPRDRLVFNMMHVYCRQNLLKSLWKKTTQICIWDIYRLLLTLIHRVIPVFAEKRFCKTQVMISGMSFPGTSFSRDKKEKGSSSWNLNCHQKALQTRRVSWRWLKISLMSCRSLQCSLPLTVHLIEKVPPEAPGVSWSFSWRKRSGQRTREGFERHHHLFSFHWFIAWLLKSPPVSGHLDKCHKLRLSVLRVDWHEWSKTMADKDAGELSLQSLNCLYDMKHVNLFSDLSSLFCPSFLSF